jgi:hypothetical protein
VPGRALVVGAAHQDLKGVDHDVAAMTSVLEARGFKVDKCVGADATRDGILGAYRRLIDQVGAGEPAVFFFSGHGGYAAAPETDGLSLQYLVPNDYDAADADDFRGIVSVELSVLQSELADKTGGNLTVILDCCHSGQLARDPHQRLKAVAPAPYQRVKAHLDRLAAGGLPVERWRNEGNPDVVRVVACAPRRPAYEYRNDQNRTVGVLTEALTMALAEATDPAMTWAVVIDRVRQRVVGMSYDQRPEVEGASDRKLFSTEPGNLLMSLPVSPIGGRRVRLDCAPLLAVEVGDEFMIMPPGAAGTDHRQRLGDLTIDRVASTWAEGPVTFAAGSPSLVGARAFRTCVHAARIRVRAARELADALAGHPLLDVIGPDEPDWVAEVTIGDDRCLTVNDRIGPLHPPRPAGPDGIAQVIRDLRILAQTTQLRRLAETRFWALNADVDLEWGRVVADTPTPTLPDAEVREGDRIYVRVRNGGAATVWVSIIDIGLTGKITILTKGAPGGWECRHGESYTFGEDRRQGVITGARLTWPTGFDPAHARPETLLVVVTSAPQDLRALEQPGIALRRSRSPVRTPLQDMIDQLATGRPRDLEAETADDTVRYDIHDITFEVKPVG